MRTCNIIRVISPARPTTRTRSNARARSPTRPRTSGVMFSTLIGAKLPEGYGVRVKRPSRYVPTINAPRQGYASGFGQNAWLLAQDSVVECIDNFEKCLTDQTGELSKHYNYNDIFFVQEDTPVKL